MAVNENLRKLLSLVKNKKVEIATHWDCDGVTSGALIYHLIKDHAKVVSTVSKGDPFLIEPSDIKENPDIIICTDIHPSPELDPDKIIYIDHHPSKEAGIFKMSIHDENAQSASLLIWRELMPETNNPYFLLLTLLGFFGDGGSDDKIPEKLLEKSKELLPELMQKKKSFYNGREYYEIEKHVSLLNVGKRVHWSGEVPFAMLRSIDSPGPFISQSHPLAKDLLEQKKALSRLYSMDVTKFEINKLECAVIECDKNIQGVLCARHMSEKPIMVLNKFNGSVIGSLRVPDNIEFNAGTFLERFNVEIDSFLGGGHEKAGGFTMDCKDLDFFLDKLKE